MIYVRLIGSAILLGVLIYFITQAVKIEDLRQIILSFPKDKLALLLTFSLVISILKAYRFLLLLWNAEVDISLWRGIRSYIASQSITPLPGGEIIRGVLLKKETGEGMSKTTSPIVTQGFLELLSATVLAIIGSFAFDMLEDVAWICMGVLVTFAFFIIHKSFFERMISLLPDWRYLKAIKQRIIEVKHNLRRDIFVNDGYLVDKVIVQALGISLVIHILGGFLIWYIASSYQANLGFFRSIFVYSSSVAIQGLSAISPGGIGFTEGGMMGILVLSSIDLGKAVAIVVLFRIITLLFSVVSGLFFLLFFYSRVLINNKTLVKGGR